MFGFNKKNQKAFISKDDEPDAFIIKRKDAYALRFTSKDLLQYFEEVFSLADFDKQVFYFKVSDLPNEKGLHELKLI